MLFPPKYYLAPLFVLVVLVGSSEAARQTVVQKISVTGNEPLQVRVQTSTPATPQAQIITGPDRLVIDVPGAVPGTALHNQTLNRSEVERVRVALFSAAPPVTRIVLDLNSPQGYSIAPTNSGFTVTVGAEGAKAEKTSPNESAISQPPTTEPSSTENASNEPVIGWVTAGASSTSASAGRRPFVIEKTPREAAKPILVQYANGQLEIHAHDAPLYDVLAMIKEQTRADITIPPFTRDERVVGDFGPGTASEVLSQLLNGTNMNFILVASPTNPSALQNVVLSLKPEGLAEYPPSDNPPQPENAAPENSEVPPPVVEPRPEDIPQQQPDTPAPPPDTPQN